VPGANDVGVGPREGDIDVVAGGLAEAARRWREAYRAWQSALRRKEALVSRYEAILTVGGDRGPRPGELDGGLSASACADGGGRQIAGTGATSSAGSRGRHG
jgi:hypothetical protein